MILKRFLIIFFCLNLVACGGKLTKENINIINTISISEHVVVPDQTMNDNPGLRIGAAFGGALGSVIADSLPTNNKDTTAYMKDNNVNVGDIVLNEFKYQIKQKSSISSKITDDKNGVSDATFVLEIQRYGLGAEHDFSSKYRPMIRMSAKLVKKSGEVIWEENDFVHHMEESILALPLAQYFTDPKIMVTKYKEVAKLAVSNILENIAE